MFEQTFKTSRRRALERGRLHDRARLHRAIVLASLPQISRRPRERAKGPSRAARQALDYILDEPHRWSSWAAPKRDDGTLDHRKTRTGPDLIAFVDTDLFPYLQSFKTRAPRPDTIEYKIGEIFGEIKSKFRSGYSLRDALDLVDQLCFGTSEQKHELSYLYEAKIKNMGNAGRNGGEYYTPRPLIRAMVKVIKPKIGERIYDGACGSAAFLCESYEYLRAQKSLSTADLKRLQERTFYGKEKKSLAYCLAILNMILHGVDAPIPTRSPRTSATFRKRIAHQSRLRSGDTPERSVIYSRHSREAHPDTNSRSTRN